MTNSFEARAQVWNPFVGRHREIMWFQTYLAEPEPEPMLLDLYGTGGIGKSTLLEHFRLIAAERGIPFLLLDSRDFVHTPVGFAQKILESEWLGTDRISSAHHNPVDEVLFRMNNAAQSGRIVLTIDTYEAMDDMDHWLRTVLLPRLSEHVFLVLSGRYRLTAEWTTAPSSSRWIHFLPLEAFDQPTCKEYASRFGITDRLRADRLYAMTRGHPLTLALLMQREGIDEEIADDPAIELAEVFRQICSRWLRELPSPVFQSLIEAASLIRIFNQEHLEHILQTKVERREFDRLSSLSFVRRSRRGWFIHDGLRQALLHDFGLRKPQEYERFQSRSVAYLYALLESAKSSDEKVLCMFDLLYVLGDSTIRATFLDEQEGRPYYWKTIQQDSVNEMKAYMDKVLGDRLTWLRNISIPTRSSGMC